MPRPIAANINHINKIRRKVESGEEFDIETLSRQINLDEDVVAYWVGHYSTAEEIEEEYDDDDNNEDD